LSPAISNLQGGQVVRHGFKEVVETLDHVVGKSGAGGLQRRCQFEQGIQPARGVQDGQPVVSLFDAARCCEGADAPKTLLGLVRCLFKPEIVRTLNLLLAFSICLKTEDPVVTADAAYAENLT
jgi:hypothetical protein